MNTVVLFLALSSQFLYVTEGEQNSCFSSVNILFSGTGPISCHSNWRAPSNRGVCTFFGSIFQVARNPLNWHADSFCVKKCPCGFFFTSREKRLQTRSWKSTPSSALPPSPSNGVKHIHAQCFSSQRSKSYNVWRQTQGGNGFSCNLIHIFLLSWKKNTGTCFNTKRI